MTRSELLTILIGRAHTNGFQFRRWYTTRLGLPWISSEAAINLLETQRRYYALLFSHDFASTFWKPGEDITFQVPSQTFQRVMPDGRTETVSRTPFTRRSSRPDAWRYHLSQMALAEEPLRYLRKYLNVEDDLAEDATAINLAALNTPPPPAKRRKKLSTKPTAKLPPGPKPKKNPKPLPKTPPAFLQRPYPPKSS
jgi:hypothetical protein